jgi:hypothetical protein
MMRVLTWKRYKCPCGTIYGTVTNHWGEIYRGCQGMGCRYGMTLPTSQCVEAEYAMLDLAREADGCPREEIPL